MGLKVTPYREDLSDCSRVSIVDLGYKYEFVEFFQSHNFFYYYI